MVTIRQLGASDAGPWAKVRAALWPETDKGELEGEITVILGRSDHVAFGAFQGEMLIGFAEVSIRPYGDGCETAPVGWLEGIFVGPEHREKQLGRLLVNAAEEWTRARGLTELGSDVHLDNVVSLAAHAKWGFAQTMTVVMFRKKLT
jgi:aminoglycoside 6'-N-acetyltransferase I